MVSVIFQAKKRKKKSYELVSYSILNNQNVRSRLLGFFIILQIKLWLVPKKLIKRYQNLFKLCMTQIMENCSRIQHLICLKIMLPQVLKFCKAYAVQTKKRGEKKEISNCEGPQILDK